MCHRIPSTVFRHRIPERFRVFHFWLITLDWRNRLFRRGYEQFDPGPVPFIWFDMAKAVKHRPGRQHSLYVLTQRIYSGNRCFYCGKLLRGGRTREHVFPLWLQKRFDLSDQHLTLLNGTLIPYRQLTVPCCPTCNNVHLSKLERRVQRLLFESPFAEAQRNLKDIYIWANKILLGIVYAERMLPLNRRYPKGRPILPPELREMFRMTHFLIQGLRFPIRFTAEGEERIPDQHSYSI
jgi:hypothetical protein